MLRPTMAYGLCTSNYTSPFSCSPLYTPLLRNARNFPIHCHCDRFIFPCVVGFLYLTKGLWYANDGFCRNVFSPEAAAISAVDANPGDSGNAAGFRVRRRGIFAQCSKSGQFPTTLCHGPMLRRHRLAKSGCLRREHCRLPTVLGSGRTPAHDLGRVWHVSVTAAAKAPDL